MTEAVGRKWALQLNVLIFIIGAVIMTSATDQLSYMCMDTTLIDEQFSDKIYRLRARSYRTGLRCDHRNCTIIHCRDLHLFDQRHSYRVVRGYLSGRVLDWLLDQLWNQQPHVGHQFSQLAGADGGAVDSCNSSLCLRIPTPREPTVVDAKRKS